MSAPGPGGDRIFRSNRADATRTRISAPASPDPGAGGDAGSALHGPLPAPAPVPVPEHVRVAVSEPIGAPPTTGEVPVLDADGAPAAPGPDQAGPHEADHETDREADHEADREADRTPPPRQSRGDAAAGGSRIAAPRAEAVSANPVFRPDLTRPSRSWESEGDDAGWARPTVDPAPAERGVPSPWGDQATSDSGRASAMDNLAALYPPPDAGQPEAPPKTRRRRLRRG